MFKRVIRINIDDVISISSVLFAVLSVALLVVVIVVVRILIKVSSAVYTHLCKICYHQY